MAGHGKRALALIFAALLVASPAFAQSISTQANSVFRDYNTPGNALSGVYNPPKADVRNLFGTITDRVGISLKDYGANGDNATVNDTAFSSAIAQCVSLGGCIINIPAGKFVISSEIAITASCSAPVYFKGAGIGATIIRQTGSAANGFRWDCGNSFARGGGLADLTVEAGTGYAASGNIYTGTGSSGAGLVANRIVTGGRFNNFAVHNFAQGVTDDGGWDNFFANFEILYFQTNGFAKGLNASIPVSGDVRLDRGLISNNSFTGDNSVSIGVNWGSSGGDQVSNLDVTSSSVACRLKPISGRAVLYMTLQNVYCDTATYDGIEIDATNGPVYSLQCVTCWASYNGEQGVHIHGSAANTDAIMFSGLRARENAQHGVNILQGKNIYISDSEINSNSRGNHNVHAGIFVDNSAGPVSISGGQCGNNASVFSDQAECIVAGAGVTINLDRVDMANAGAGKSPYLLGSGSVVTSTLTAVPAPTASVLGGTFSTTCSANQFVTGINTSGTPTCATPSTAAAGSSGQFQTNSSGSLAGVTISGAVAVDGTTGVSTLTGGVSCSGAPTASFASTGGVITHC